MQGAGGGQCPEFGVGRGVPKEISQARGQGVVVQASGLLLEVEVGRRAEHGGVTGEHRFGESTAGLHCSEDDRQEADLLLRRDRRAIGLLHEATEQTLRILGRIVRLDVIAERRTDGALHR